MKLSEIKLNKANPRLIKDDKFHKLVQSIKEFPKMMALRPIVIDNDGTILGGNMRFKALTELGYKEVPDEWIKRADALTDDEKQRFIIEDNVGFGEWDFEALQDWDTDKLDEWGLDVPEWDDYSEKNEEIDFDNLSDEMMIKLVYPESEYEQVKEQLSKIAATPEQAVWKLLGNE